MAKGVTIEKLTELVDALNIARSTVYVSATALDHGETDLELQSATVLKRAFETMNEVYDQLVSMRNHAPWHRPMLVREVVNG
jgi:hypothetical protein